MSIVVLQVKILKTQPEKAMGLIGVSPVYPVFFTTRWGIHTFGVKSALDVLILDKDHRVIKLTCGLKPNRFFFWNPKHMNVLELPSGDIKNKSIKIGDQIQFQT